MRDWILCLFVGALLGAALIGTGWRHDRALATKDAGHLFPAIKAKVAKAWMRGRVPVWNLDVGCGTPLLADPMTQALYPPNAVFLGRDPLEGMKWFVWLHLMLFVPGFVYAARARGVSLQAALVVAIAFVGAGAVLSQHWSVLWTGGLLGLLFALGGLFRLVDAPRRSSVRVKAAVALVLGAAWIVYAGAFEVLLAFCVWCALELAVLSCSRDRASVLSAVGAVSVCALLALLLGAAQLLPSFELLSLSSRHGGLERSSATLWSLAPERWIELLAPGFFGLPATRTSWATALAPHPLGVPYLGGIFVGAPLFALAAAALVHGETKRFRRHAFTLLVVFVVTLLLAAGDHLPLFAWARRVVPGVALFRYPEKILTLSTLALSLLAAHGLDRLLRHDARAWRLTVRASAGIACALLLFGLWWWLGADSILPWLQRRIDAANLRVAPTRAWELGLFALARGALFALLSALFAGAARRATPPTQTRFTAAFLLLVAATTPLCNRSLIEIRKRSTILARPPGLPPPSAFDTPAGPMRLQLEHRLFEPHHASLLGYRSASSYGAVALEDERRFDRLLAEKPRLRYRLSSVRYVYGVSEQLGSKPIVLELRDALPRASLVPLARRAADDTALAALMRRRTWEPRIEVVLAPEPFEGRYKNSPPLPEGGVGPATQWSPPVVRLLEEQPERLVWSVETTSGGWFVVTDALYPGWRTRVDGRAVPTERANLRFRAVRIEAGTHEVVMTFRSRSARLGARISLVTLLLVLVIASWRKARARERRTAKPSRG